MTALHDAEIAAREVAQLTGQNDRLRVELANALKVRDDAIDAASRALKAAQRGNAVAQAVIQQKAALIAWQHTDNPVTRTRLEVARVAVSDALKAWADGQK
jgi:hypothetical protein